MDTARAPQPPQPGRVQPADILPADQHAARRDRAVARQRPQRGQRDGGFAAAGLTHQPVGLAFADPQRHAAQHRLVAAPHAVADHQVAQLQRGHARRRQRNAPAMPSAIRFTPTTREAVAPAVNAAVHQ